MLICVVLFVVVFVLWCVECVMRVGWCVVVLVCGGLFGLIDCVVLLCYGLGWGWLCLVWCVYVRVLCCVVCVLQRVCCCGVFGLVYLRVGVVGFGCIMAVAWLWLGRVCVLCCSVLCVMLL